MQISQDIQNRVAQIRLVVLDVDGVLTDRKIYFTANGDEIKAFNAHDGHGIKMLLSSGVEVGIITARQSSMVQRRMDELGVRYVYQGRREKLPALESLCQELSLSLEQVAMVGDDLPDLLLMRRVGLGIAVADAVPFVRQHAHCHTQLLGGYGAVREVCDFILEAQGNLTHIHEQYL